MFKILKYSSITSNINFNCGSSDSNLWPNMIEQITLHTALSIKCLGLKAESAKDKKILVIVLSIQALIKVYVLLHLLNW